MHGGTEPEAVTGAIMTPVFQTSTYVQPRPAEAKLHEYSRTGNPTRDALQGALATLEGADPATGCLAFSSGMSAIDAVLRLLQAGDHVVAGDDLYGGTYRLFTKVLRRHGLSFSFVDTSDPAAVREAVRPETKQAWAEPPTNPLPKVADIAALAEVAREAGVLLGVDTIRVGMEDHIHMYPHRDEKIKRSADEVRKIATISRELGRDIATPAEARKMMGIRPA